MKFDVVIGLGKGPTNIIQEMNKLGVKDVDLCSISPLSSSLPFSFILSHKKEPEDYEKDFPYFEMFDQIEVLHPNECHILIVICGGSLTSCVVGPVIEQLKNHHFDPQNISVLFVQPDEDLIDKKKQMMSKVVFHILQEWARSGAIKEMFIVSNKKIDNIFNGLSLAKYYQEINKIIANSLISLREFQVLPSAFEQINDLPIGARIGTFSLCIWDKNEEITTKDLFSLANTTDVCYYLAYPNEDLENDKSILSSLKKLNEENKRVSFKTFATDFQKKYGYCVKKTSVIQQK